MLEGNKILGFIGCGTMGEAIMRGVLRAGALTPAQVQGADRYKKTADAVAERHGVRTTTDAEEVARLASVVVVAVKPQTMKDALDTEGMRKALAGKLVISVAAGVRVEQIAAWLPGIAIIRAMPNTPALIGEGMTALARGLGVTDAQIALAMEIFQACGRCVEIDEKNMDVVTALNGSGPAFVYLMLESLADGAVMMGMRRDVAFQMAAQMFQGSARMVLETGLHPAALKDQVTTPGGCTIAGLLTLEDGRIRSVLARAVEEATRVAGGLGNK
ncbi:MAG: pyrroline-5-carboxylate reductase [Myxococcales bacterium]|nr:pyrroline-5-carboxylate reductase [Myxococcales bacterium]